ncbi:hypothetical protein MATL_G00050580 [Megalops atlanticus]|uniref:Thyroglobulin type-1 domain-containing protein n=1 Tax=Megalops atlanticus TaxID=7932 RepID=A0A9D3TAW8_MEGAT|nr:hypothetical protein MATL_G00050580 [Megalops atlanticus]
MAEQQNEPLLAPPAEGTVVNMGTPRDDSSKKAFRVAGFTVLACLLIAGQALTAYFVLSQKTQITNLEQQSDSLKKELNRRPSGGSSASKAMHMPSYNLPMMIDDASEQLKPQGDPSLLTKCQQEASAPQTDSTGFRPMCDRQGGYMPMQCWRSTGLCWCVSKDGVKIADTVTSGIPSCGGMVAASRGLAFAPSQLKSSDE